MTGQYLRHFRARAYFSVLKNRDKAANLLTFIAEVKTKDIAHYVLKRLGSFSCSQPFSPSYWPSTNEWQSGWLIPYLQL